MASVGSFLKKNFLTGLIVSIPVVLTAFAVVWLFKSVDGILAPLYKKLLGRSVPGLGFVSAFVLVLAVGIISTNMMGRKLIGLLEKVFHRLPVFKGVYAALKQVVEAFSPGKADRAFRRFVIVPYPREGSWAFGFLTKECTVEKARESLPLTAVYIPTNNLYLGEVVLFKREDVIYTAIPVEEGVKIVLSGGIAMPERIAGASR